MQLKSTSQIDEIGKIHQWVEKRTHGAIEDLSVSIVNDVIVLSGRTTTYYSKQLATEAAKNTSSASESGGLKLSNEINVRVLNAN